jgi:shikimate kinase
MSWALIEPRRVFLIGPMGVGKTTIGRLLAKELGLKFIDSDQEIRESHVIDELTERHGLLLATGGGAVLNQENRQRLDDRGIVIHLDTSVDLLVRRTAKDKKRPLLQNKNPRLVLEQIKKDRDPLYREIADIHIFVGDTNSRKVVKLALHELSEKGFLKEL